MKSLIAALLLFSLPAMAEFQVPNLPNPVNDYANVLTRQGKERIASTIVQLKKDTGAQAGVLIVNTLDGTSIEEASMAVARQWKLGSKEKDDGILLLVAVKDHKMRLEVGYGLESIVTDAKAREITGSMKSFLRKNDFDGGVNQAIASVNSVIQAHAQEIVTKTTTPTDDSGFSTFLLIILGVFGAGTVGFFMFLRSDKKRLEKERKRQRLEEEERKTAKRTRGAYIPPARKTTKKEEPKKETKSRKKDDDDSFGSGFVAGSLFGSSSSSSSSSSDWGSGSSGSDWGGGGGDFGGGGSSDSW